MKRSTIHSRKALSLFLALCLTISLFACVSSVTAVAADDTASGVNGAVSVGITVEDEPLLASAASEKPNGDTEHAAHCYCGGLFDGKNGHTCTDDVVWQELPATATSLPKSGNYFLSGNITITETTKYTITGDLHICFNGYTVTFAKRGIIYEIPTSNEKGVEVSFCDCDPDYEGGIIHHSCSSNSSGVVLYALKNENYTNTINVYGGIFDTSDSYCSSGGTFCLKGTNILNIYDGTIIRSGTTNVSGVDYTVPNCTLGGSICALDSSKVNIMGGTFQGCVATRNDSAAGYGGVVCARNTSEVSISGGTYIDCSAVKNGTIGATQETGKITVSGRITVKNCNSKDYFYNAKTGTLIMEEGAEIFEGIKPQGDTDHPSHCYCGGLFDGKNGHTCTGSVEWQELPATATLLPESGNYYLSGNISISENTKYNITDDLHICFNGYTITFAKRGIIYEIPSTNAKGVNVSFCNCETDYESGITHRNCSSNSSGIVLASTGTTNTNTVDVFGGTFDTTDSYCASGGTFCIGGTSVLNIYDATIIRSGATNVSGVESKIPNCTQGGSICALDTSKVNIYGGTFRGCVATRNDGLSGFGGVVCARNNSEVTISGGSYSDCSAVLGGGIAATRENGKITVNGRLEVKNCHSESGGLFYNYGTGTMLIENGAAMEGGIATAGGCIWNKGKLRISGDIATFDSSGKYVSGTLISGGKAVKGGCVYHEGSELTISGGTIANGVGKADTKDTYKNTDGGGNIYLGASGKTCNMSGGLVTNGSAYSTGGNIYVIKGSTFNHTGGTVEKGHSYYVSGTSFSGGNVYVGGTYTMDDTDKSDSVYPIVMAGVADESGGGNFSINQVTARLYIKGGLVKNGCSQDKGKGNIYSWYKSDIGSVVISGGTITNDEDFEPEKDYNKGGIGISIYQTTDRSICFTGNPQVLDNINIQQQSTTESYTSVAKITVSDGFDGKLKMVRLVNEKYNLITFEGDQSYEIGADWDDDYTVDDKVHFYSFYKATYNSEDGSVVISKTDNFEKSAQINSYGQNGFNLADRDKINEIIANIDTYFPSYILEDFTVFGADSIVKNLTRQLEKYDDMQTVHIGVTDNYGKNGDKVLLTLYSCMDEDGINAGNENKDYGYDYARIIVTKDGKTYGEGNHITDAFKTVNINNKNIVDADTITIYDYVYFTELILNKSDFTGDNKIKVKSCITTVDGNDYFGKEIEIKLMDLYPLNNYEAGISENFGHGATKADAEIVEKAYEGTNAYHGDMHDHSNSGGTSDGKVALSEWKGMVEDLGLDFQTILDHKQVLHMTLDEWPENFIGGSEASSSEIMSENGWAKLHYDMVFADPQGLVSVLNQFPEFKYTCPEDDVDGTQGHFIYPKFTRARFEELVQAVLDAGGYFSIPHPTSTSDCIVPDDSPLWYYYGDYTGLMVLQKTPDGTGTKANYEVWKALLQLGHRVYVAAGCDAHNTASDKSPTTIYAPENKPATLLDIIRTGNTTAGGVGIRMVMGDTVTGGHKVFTDGEKLVIAVGDFLPAVADGYSFMIKVYAGENLIAEEVIEADKMNYFSFNVDASAPYYRAVVYRTDRDENIVAYGNPIWNDAE